MTPSISARGIIWVSHCVRSAGSTSNRLIQEDNCWLRRERLPVYYNLASSKRIEASDPDFAAMKRLAKDVGAFKLEDQIGLHFALGKAYARCRRSCRALSTSWRRAMRSNAGNSWAMTKQTAVAAPLSGSARPFSAGFFALQRPAPANPVAPVPPVFIIGMPRSGTSLVEQILASHPKVFGAGERYELGDLADAIEGKNGAELPEAVAGMSSAELNALGTNYVTAMRALLPMLRASSTKCRAISSTPGFCILRCRTRASSTPGAIRATRRCPVFQFCSRWVTPTPMTSANSAATSPPISG